MALKLRADGYKLLDLNWRLSACEVDIIAYKDTCVYFVEVRYRATAGQGGGLATLTAKKLHHMRRAAEIWTLQQGWRGEYCLLAAGVDRAGTIELIEL